MPNDQIPHQNLANQYEVGDLFVIDKGNQASEGESMINLGNVIHPEVAGDEYKIKTLHNQGRPFEVATDTEGRIWMIVGTDSGFEGLSAFDYTSITYSFTPR